MTREQIEKMSREYADAIVGSTLGDYGAQWIKAREGFIAGAESRQPEIDELIQMLLHIVYAEIDVAPTREAVDAIWEKYPTLQTNDNFTIRCLNRKGLIAAKTK